MSSGAATLPPANNKTWPKKQKGRDVLAALLHLCDAHVETAASAVQLEFKRG
jgi:hypothetical protein